MLTQAQSEKRKSLITSDVNYSLYLYLPSKEQSFFGYVEISFVLAAIDEVFFDFNGDSVAMVAINGEELDKVAVEKLIKDHKIFLEQTRLRIGENKIRIKFSNAFSLDGEGLHSFTDPNGNCFIYSQLEPYNCNRIFPCFDQPDIKALVSLYLNTEGKLVRVANETKAHESVSTKFVPDDEFSTSFAKIYPEHFTDENKTITKFHETQMISSYLVGMAVGDFKEIVYTGGDSVPMSIFVSGALEKFAQKQQNEIFIFTKLGIQFYETFFQTKYPYKKFDFVFAPEFTIGGMENTGIIIFTDKVIFKEQPTTLQITRRGHLILHELAHMWFGNLTTIRWWNDLWLKESFAEFVSFLALEGIKSQLGFQVTEPWAVFCTENRWGYTDDQEVTTHPIAGKVENTSVAETTFDGITYAKGAATLKQLYRRIGHDNFSRKIAGYFAKFAWKNAALEDFLGELEGGDDSQGLREWREQWLQKAGLNVLEAVWTPGDEKLVIRQTVALSDHPTLRTHQISLGLFGEEGKLEEVIEVRVEDREETEVSLPGRRFFAVFPNYNEWTYARVTFDPISKDFFLQNYSKLDLMNKVLLIENLFEMVKDAKMSAEEFISFILNKNLQAAEEPFEFSIFLDKLSESLSFVPKAEAWKLSEKIFDILKERFEKEKNIENLGALRAKIFKFSLTKNSIASLASIVAAPPQNVQFTEDEIWKSRFLLTGAKEADEALIAQIEKKSEALEKSETSQKFSLAIDALTEDPQKLDLIVSSILSLQKKISYSDISYIASGLTFRLKNQELLRPYVERVIEAIPDIEKATNRSVFRELVHLVVSHWAPEQSVKDIDQLLQKTETLSDGALIELKKLRGEYERYVRGQEFFRNSKKETN